MREVAVGATLLIVAGAFLLVGSKRITARAELKLEPVTETIQDNTPQPRKPKKRRIGIVSTEVRLSEDLLECIRRIESGGNYSAISEPGMCEGGDRRCYGAYQWNQSAWLNNFSGRSPSEVSPSEQDALAQNYISRRGLQPWPVPSRVCR